PLPQPFCHVPPQVGHVVVIAELPQLIRGAAPGEPRPKGQVHLTLDDDLHILSRVRPALIELKVIGRHWQNGGRGRNRLWRPARHPAPHIVVVPARPRDRELHLLAEGPGHKAHVESHHSRRTTRSRMPWVVSRTPVLPISGRAWPLRAMVKGSLGARSVPLSTRSMTASCSSRPMPWAAS